MTARAWFSRFVYDIRPVNGAGLFFQPRSPRGATIRWVADLFRVCGSEEVTTASPRLPFVTSREHVCDRRQPMGSPPPVSGRKPFPVLFHPSIVPRAGPSSPPPTPTCTACARVSTTLISPAAVTSTLRCA